MRDETVQDALDESVLRVRRRQNLTLVLLDDLLVQLLPGLLLCACRDDIEAPTTRDLCSSLIS